MARDLVKELQDIGKMVSDVIAERNRLLAGPVIIITEHTRQPNRVPILDGTETFQRRCCVDRLTPAETAIRNAQVAIEGIGAHERLTKAGTLLMEARELIADYLEQDAPLDNPDMGIR